EIFLIDAMHLVDARAGKFDWPAYAEIVLQNPAEFNMSKRTRFVAPAYFLDERQNDRAAGGLAMQGAADAKQREPPGRKGVVPDPRDGGSHAEREQPAAEIGGYFMQVRQNDPKRLRHAAQFDHEPAFWRHHQL